MRMAPPECMAGCQARHTACVRDTGTEGCLHFSGSAYGCCCLRDLDLNPNYKEAGLICISVMCKSMLAPCGRRPRCS